ncbi:MAG: GNAT family N-acetyltransferase, partial [Saprospiraceae bacterium]
MLVTDSLQLELIEPKHAQPIFDLAAANREHLRQWLPWVDRMETVDFIENYIRGAQQRQAEGGELPYVILENSVVVGRIGIHKIDNQNKIGEIGYWIGQEFSGRGLMTQACKAVLEVGFRELGLNRIEIKCGTENRKSQVIPERLGFVQEGILRQ